MLTLRNVLFLLVLTTVWGALHYYVGRRLLPVLVADDRRRRWAWGLLFGAGATAPLTFLAMRFTGALWADLFQRFGYVLIGLFSIAFVLLVFRDLALLAVWAVDRLVGRTSLADAGRRALFTRLTGGAVVGISGLLTAIGHTRAIRLAEVEHVELPVPDLPPALDGFRIAQVSDIHVGPTIRRDDVEAIVARVNALAPDLVAVTGDLVDGTVDRIGSDVAPLGALRATHGAFFCTGNHEYYSGADAWCDEVARLGLRVLSQSHALVTHGGVRVLVAGITDPESARYGGPRPDPRAAKAGAPPHDYSILLAHRPRAVREAAPLGYDLQLSGHTHGGQYFPFTLLIRLFQPFSTGLHRIGRTFLYVNRGTTYWGPPIRLGSPQEITLLVLRRA